MYQFNFSDEKPKVSISADSKSYVVGDNFDLTCKGNSPNISWAGKFRDPILSNPV